MIMRCRSEIRERAFKAGGFNLDVRLECPAIFEPAKKRHWIECSRNRRGQSTRESFRTATFNKVPATLADGISACLLSLDFILTLATGILPSCLILNQRICTTLSHFGRAPAFDSYQQTNTSDSGTPNREHLSSLGPKRFGSPCHCEINS
jgi:hypothetical protein